MWRLIWIPARAFLEIALGRRGPQDVPASHGLFLLSFAAYCAATFALTGLAEPLDVAFKAAAVDAVVLPAFALATLWLRSRQYRWLQSLTALAGVGALFTALAMAPFAVMAGMPETPLSGIASVLVLALFAWNVLAVGHILRHALSVSFPVGVLVAMAYVAVNTAVVGYLVPEVAS
jgi:hypothetical protein